MKGAGKNRRRLGVVAALAALALLLATLVLNGRAQITTDIFALLPEAQRDPLAAAAMAQAREAFFDEVSVVISAPLEKREQAAAAAGNVRALLTKAPLEIREPGAMAAQLRAAYREDRFRWLTSADRAALSADPGNAFRQGLAMQLARPGMFDPADPAGFLSRFIMSLPAPGAGWTLVQGMPAKVVDDAVHFLINARLTADPLDPAIQQLVADTFDAAGRDALANCEGCSLHWTGAVRFSAATRLAAERDITVLSTVALAGIGLLFLLAFRALRPLLVAVAVLISATLAGLAASFAVFGSVHALTLVFGTTLLGICIDYVLHLLVHRWANPRDTSETVLRAIAPGLALGLVTSATAFLFLLFAGFPALSQLAVFALAGLITSWLLVIFWVRDAVAPQTENTAIARFLQTPFALPARIRGLLLGVLGLAALAGLPQLRIVDDVRGLQAMPGALVDADRVVRSVMQGLPGNTGGADFFLVEADSLDAALDREAALFAAAAEPGAFGLSRFVPPVAVQETNRRAHAPLFAKDARELRDSLAAFGFLPEIGTQLADAYAQDAMSPSARMLERPGLEALRLLHVEAHGTHGLIARIPGLSQVPAGIEGVRLVRPLEEVEDTFSAIRQRGVIAVAAAYLMMILVLTRRYGFSGALGALSPAVLGAGIALGLLGLAGLPLNIFSLVALILVLGIGADYALFLCEGAAHAGTVRLATAMAAATSLLSFGLLAFSSLPALRAFGFTVAAGILAAYLAAPLALRPLRRKSEPVTENAG